MIRTPSLRIIQAIAVCVCSRNKEGALQGLRILLDLPDAEDAERMIRLLLNELSPGDRFWLGTINGERKNAAMMT
jgi:hypothetical protein